MAHQRFLGKSSLFSSTSAQEQRTPYPLPVEHYERTINGSPIQGSRRRQDASRTLGRKKHCNNNLSRANLFDGSVCVAIQQCRIDRRQAVIASRPLTGFRTGVEFAAGAGPLLVNRAANEFANSTAQGNASCRLLFGSLHRHVMRRDGYGQVLGNRAERVSIGLSPIKRDTEVGAAGAAALAKVTHRMFVQIASPSGRRVFCDNAGAI